MDPTRAKIPRVILERSALHEAKNLARKVNKKSCHLNFNQLHNKPKFISNNQSRQQFSKKVLQKVKNCDTIKLPHKLNKSLVTGMGEVYLFSFMAKMCAPSSCASPYFVQDSDSICVVAMESRIFRARLRSRTFIFEGERKMKKLLTLFFVVLVLTLALASCGTKEPEHVHTWVIDPAVEPTCTESGLTEGSHCSGCGAVNISQQYVAPLKHIRETIPSVESTCTEHGFTEGEKCGRCGEILIVPEELPLIEHTWEDIPGYDSTCISTGLTWGYKCEVCDTILVEQEEIPLRAHTYDNADDAICNVCEYERFCPHRNTEVLPAVESTCTSYGLTEGSKCLDCNEIVVAQTSVALKDHTEEIIPAVAATCTQTGLTEGKKCSVCDTILVGQKLVNALGHTAGEWVIDIEATKTEDGLARKYCTVCGEILEEGVMGAGSQNLLYEINEDGTSYSVRSTGKCSDTDILIPSVHYGLPVTKINTNFMGYYSYVASVIMPDSIIEIDENAFYRSKIKSIVLSNSIKEIKANTFGKCSSLVSIAIPDSVIKIAASAFEDCTMLESVTFGENSQLTLLRGFTGCSALSEINIPNSVTSIYNSTFCNCTSLESLVLPDSITEIGHGAFKNCSSLKNINIPKSLISVGSGAFEGSSLPLTQYDNAYYLGNNDNPYYILLNAIDRSIETCNIHNDTIIIAAHAFSNSTGAGCPNLHTVTIGNSVKYIGWAAFSGCTSLQNITIPDSVISIDSAAFFDCTSLAWAVVNAKKIGDSAFSRCSSLMTVSMKAGIESIGESSFQNCVNLWRIIIPDTVTSIGDNAFYGCTSIESIVIPNSVISMGENVFESCDNNIEIYCEAELQPDSWNGNWNVYAYIPSDKSYLYHSVIWGYKPEQNN